MSCINEKPEDDFFKARWTKVWNFSDKRVLFCKDCISKLLTEYTNRYGEQTALMICCALLDIPFYATLYKSISENNTFFNIGLYCRQLNCGQYQYQNFSNSLVNGECSKTEQQIKEEIETRWSKADKQNMAFAISTVGYDPFDNCGMTDNDRKYCFNMLARYCDCTGIKQDGHKIQSVVQITQAQLQCRKIDEMINTELLTTAPDEKKIKELTGTKKLLLDSIAKIAQDNNLASAYNKNSDSGNSTLTEKLKELEENDYQEIKVNLFDIKTCGAIKQIMDISNQSILDQLTLTEDEKLKMIAEQKEKLDEINSSLEIFEEENRMLKNKILDLENKKRK